MKEFFRKKVVGLKRGPQIIPLLFLVISCCIYTFSLRYYSTASIGLQNDNFFQQLTHGQVNVPVLMQNPAIYMFVQTLFSILLVITYLSVYKKGKRNNFMFSIVLIMIVVMIACEILYYFSIDFYTTQLIGYDYTVITDPITKEQTFPLILDALGNPVVKDYSVEKNEAMNAAIQTTIVHTVFLVISLILVLILPLISKALNKINTDVDDEYDRLMEQKTEEELMIDLEDE